MSNKLRNQSPEFLQQIFDACQLRLNGAHQQAIELLTDVTNSTGNRFAWRLLYQCLIESDAVEDASSCLDRWIDGHREDESAKHLMAALNGSTLPDRAPANFATSSFDLFASTYEALMTRWNYSGQICIQVLLGEVGKTKKFAKVLDAGCGTGLLSESLRALSGHLTGIDLSAEMLEHAANKNTYDQLICSDMFAYTENYKETFDLIVASDSFTYFGNLELLIRNCFAALKPSGWLVFSLQEGPLDHDGFYLRSDGSFVHSPHYLIEQLGEAGLASGSIQRVVLREEFHQKVYGLVIAAQRP